MSKIKNHKYKIGDNVIIDNPLHDNIENIKYVSGAIHDLQYGRIFDYTIKTKKLGYIRVKESEIGLIKDVNM